MTAWSIASGRAPIPTDFGIFGSAGVHLLQGRLDQVYSDPANQGGPLELIPAGIAKLSGTEAPWGWAVYYSATIWLVLVGVAYVLLSVLGPPRRVVSYSIMGSSVFALLVAFIPDALKYGHSAQAVIPLMWIGAAVCVSRGHSTTAAAVVALSSGFETWGILGCALLLAAPRRSWPLAALVGAGIVAALYLPFVLTGHFAMFEYSWPVDRATIVGRLLPDQVVFPWSLRLLQGALSMVAGGVAAVLASRGEDGIWIAPLAVVVVRLAADPLLQPHYWAEVAVILSVVLPLAIVRRTWAVVVLCAAALVVLRVAFVASTSG